MAAEMAVDTEALARAIPKAELHLHLEGAIAASTVVDLARKNSVSLKAFDSVSEMFLFPDLATFLKVYDVCCQVLHDASDLQRVTYEALARSAGGGARYVEFFFSPLVHRDLGVPYATMLDGIIAGMRDAQRDYRVQSRLIPAYNRELGPGPGDSFLDMVLSDRREEVIGIGLDYGERDNPAAPFKPIYDRARAAGLHVTAHAGEDGPAQNVRDSLDVLHCERIDHGYHVVDDPELVSRCRERGTYFTVCPTTTISTTVWRDIGSPDHAIRRMIGSGLNVMINTDDPALFRTDLAHEYSLVMRNMGLSGKQIKEIALNGIRASWLDEATKRSWLAQWSAEIDQLIPAAGS